MTMNHKNSLVRRHVDEHLSLWTRHDCLGVMRTPLDLALLLEKLDPAGPETGTAGGNAPVIQPGARIRLLDHQTGETFTADLCHPDEAQPELGKISVLSPLGSELLGLRRGAVADIRILRQHLRFTVVDIVQPTCCSRQASAPAAAGATGQGNADS